MMREPAFWWTKPGLGAHLLRPCGALYGMFAAARMRRAGVAVGIPVICVGNLTLGGTGKTPAAIAIGRMLQTMGKKPFFLSRGYGGRLTGPVLVDPQRHGASEVGDEPLLLARIAPTIIARDRIAGARHARESGATVIVMDDGLQNPSLKKNFSLAVIDGRRGIGNALIFPAGPLRAPLAAQLAAIDALLIMGASLPPMEQFLRRHSSIPAHHATLTPDPQSVRAIGQRKILAFAGIGEPEKFFRTLTAAGLRVAATESFPDHHPFTEADAARLLARCERDDLVPMTTEKDQVRLAGGETRMALARRSHVLAVTLTWKDADAIATALKNALQK